MTADLLPPNRALAPARAGWHALERSIDALLGPAGNPLRHLGALGLLLFWLLAGSGIYLYAVLDTSATGAWHSIDTTHFSRAPTSNGRVSFS